MRNIKHKTYNNFMLVMKHIQNKGYDFNEAEKITHNIFNQFENNSMGLSINQLINMIVQKEEHNEN